MRSPLVLLLLGLPFLAHALTPAQTQLLLAAAKNQIGVTVHYDPRYVQLRYPNGDVPADRGVCSDVVIRALRAVGLDLQQALHEDMRAHFARYPQRWGLRRPDRNIDHRRVPNLERYFIRRGWQRPLLRGALNDPQPGDLVTYLLPGNLPHIGIVSNQRSTDGERYLLLHNIGAGAASEDVIQNWPIVGHFRVDLDTRLPR